MINGLINWFKMILHRWRMKKQLDKLRKQDPFIY
jgi:hypothetical protein